jgi:hypothetical protein
LRKEFQGNGPASPEAVTMNEKIAKRKRDEADTGNDEYVDVSWVLGSAAEVERLWSVAKYILTETRRQMDPAMFETIIFLKINHEYWSQATVCEAIMNVKKARAAARPDDRFEDGSDDSDQTSFRIKFVDLAVACHLVKPKHRNVVKPSSRQVVQSSQVESSSP